MRTLKRNCTETNRDHTNEYARGKVKEVKTSGNFVCGGCGRLYSHSGGLEAVGLKQLRVNRS